MSIQPADTVRDWAAIRADFPLLTREVHGKPLAWFDNAARDDGGHGAPSENAPGGPGTAA